MTPSATTLLLINRFSTFALVVAAEVEADLEAVGARMDAMGAGREVCLKKWCFDSLVCR